MNKQGFTLLEVILVILLIALIVSMTTVFSVRAFTSNKEKKRITRLIMDLDGLRDQSISEMKNSRIQAKEKKLQLFLGEKQVKEYLFAEDETIDLDHDIYFNKYGLTNGGGIAITLTSGYLITIREVRGEITLEKL